MMSLASLCGYAAFCLNAASGSSVFTALFTKPGLVYAYSQPSERWSYVAVVAEDSEPSQVTKLGAAARQPRETSPEIAVLRTPNLLQQKPPAKPAPKPKKPTGTAPSTTTPQASLALATTPSTTTPSTATDTTPNPPKATSSVPKKINNVFAESELKQALNDLSAQTGVTIVADETVSGTISATLKDATVEQALNIMLMPGNYSWIQDGDVYLIGKADPTSPNFLKFAKTMMYHANYVTSDRLVALLPQSEATYVRSAPSGSWLSVTAAPKTMERILADLKGIDRAPSKVMLEALVTEISSEDLNSFSFSWNWHNFGQAIDATGATFNYAAANATDVASILSLVSKGIARVRANPKVATDEGNEASVEVAQESYFQVVTGPANYPYTTVQSIKTGISLKMKPTVSDTGDITVQLSPEVSDAIGSGSNGLPINTIRRASTTVHVKAGQSIVIGGMQYTSDRKTDQKVPLLGDIPLLGRFFRSHQHDLKKTEVIIMITPRLIE